MGCLLTVGDGMRFCHLGENVVFKGMPRFDCQKLHLVDVALKREGLDARVHVNK